MCPPAYMMAASMVIGAVGQMQANAAAKKQIKAISSQNQVKREAEIHNYAVDTARRRRAAKEVSATNQVLMSAMGISGYEGTAVDIIGAPEVAFEVEQLHQEEALQQRIFSLDTTASNLMQDISFGRKASGFDFLAGTAMQYAKYSSSQTPSTPSISSGNQTQERP